MRDILEDPEVTVFEAQEQTRMDDNGVNTTEQMVGDDDIDGIHEAHNYIPPSIVLSACGVPRPRRLSLALDAAKLLRKEVSST